ncbi:hypothetical protein GW17_00007969, partial [Ensete ventricosum]
MPVRTGMASGDPWILVVRYISKPRFAISTCTARYGRYILVRQVTGTQTARYRAVPSKINCQRSISTIDSRLKKKSTVGDRLREKSTVGGRLREKSTVGSRLREKSTVGGRLWKKKGRRRGKEKKKRGEERIPRPHAVLTRLPLPPAGRLHAVAARGRFFSHTRRKIEA